MSETVQDTSPVVQSVEIRATPERVFELFTDPEQLVKWWPDAADLEPRVGGKMRFVFDRGEVTGEVTRFEPPSALGFTWNSEQAPGVVTQVDVTLEDLGDGRCRVELVHSGWEAAPEARAIHEQGWRHFLGILVEFAEGRAVDKRWR